MNCKNCGHSVDGKFCGHCGQSSKVGRINLANFLNELSESIFQINRGFFYTLRALFVRPGNSLREFLNGKRKNHFKPIAYVLTLSTLYFLISQLTNQNTWMDDLVSGFMIGASGENPEAEVPAILAWFAKSYAYSTLLLLPVFSLASYLLFFKSGTNYLEHVVINSYITGHQAIFYTLFTILGTFVESEALGVLPVLVAASYTCWVFWQFFTEGNRVVNILRSIMTYVLYLVFSLVLFSALMRITQFVE